MFSSLACTVPSGPVSEVARHTGLQTYHAQGLQVTQYDVSGLLRLLPYGAAHKVCVGREEMPCLPPSLLPVRFEGFRQSPVPLPRCHGGLHNVITAPDFIKHHTESHWAQESECYSLSGL